MKKTDRLLVFGGNGFVGRELIAALKKSGFKQIISLNRSAPKNKIPGVQYFSRVDLTRPQSFAKIIRARDWVVNLAGLVSFLRKDRSKVFEINALGSLNLLRVCEQKKVARLVQISSSAALGFGQKKISETTEFAWEKFQNLTYSHSKFFPNFQIDSAKIPTNIVFPPLVLGPGDPTSAVRIFDFVKNKKRIFVPDGANAFIDVRDLATAIRLVLVKAKPKENFIALGENISSQKLFGTAARVLGQRTVIRILPQNLCSLASGCARIAEFFGAPIPAENIFLGFQKRVFDSKKISRELGFRPQFSLEKSLRDWFKISEK
ncbi:MAG: NAD-dependent epimerase/dehydratase family protein [Patescibacteria group bacterium]